jgi:glucose-1-phosphate adenylyltransferase
MKADLDLMMHACVSCGSRDYQTLALVFSHTSSAHLGKLTSGRCTSALPFAGRYRLIDFALSNCANSGIGSVGVIAQYQPCSLRDHLVHGRPWGLDRRQGGIAYRLSRAATGAWDAVEGRSSRVLGSALA